MDSEKEIGKQRRIQICSFLSDLPTNGIHPILGFCIRNILFGINALFIGYIHAKINSTAVWFASQWF